MKIEVAGGRIIVDYEKKHLTEDEAKYLELIIKQFLEEKPKKKEGDDNQVQSNS